MDKKEIFKNIYEDFFGIESIEKRNEKLAKDIENLDEIPAIEVKKESIETSQREVKEVDLESKEEKDNFMSELFIKIDNLYIDDKSKELLKKVIEYMRKYYEKIEKQYISFNMCIYSDNKETVSQIQEILLDAGVLFEYIKQGQAATFSLYDVEEASQIEQMYNNKNSIVLIKNFEGFNTQDDKFKDKLINKLDEFATKQENNVLTILNAKNKEIIEEAFSKNEEAIQKFYDFEIFGIKPDVQDAYQDILEKLKDSMEISEEDSVRLLDYISGTYANNNLSYPEYRDNLYQKILFSKEIPEAQKEKSMEEIFAELNSLVGLGKVKEMLNDLVNLIELKSKSQDNLKIKNINLHMVFLGNPGTGKTTVARIVAQMLYNLKYIKQNKLIEVSSKDLVAEYVGQTAPKTMAVIQKALRRSTIYR